MDTVAAALIQDVWDQRRPGLSSHSRRPSASREGDGFADVWYRGYFAWEYKRPGGDLEKAYKQLKLYAEALENPPLLIVSVMEKIEIHTKWTNSASQAAGAQSGAG